MSTSITLLPSSNNILTGSAATLVASSNMVRNFDPSTDYVELHVLNPIGGILYSNSNFTNYTIPGLGPQLSGSISVQELKFNPESDLKNLGITSGEYKLQYNILRPQIVPGNNKSFFIKEISSDRTEIRLSTNTISTTDLQVNFVKFSTNFQSLTYFKEFYLNFGRNELVPFVNVAFDIGASTTETNPVTGLVTATVTGIPTILIKLLNPLPLKYGINTLVSLADEISNPQIFQAVITPDPIPVVYPTLRNPNFDLDLDNLRVGPTPYYNFNQITTFSGSFAPQLQQLLGQLSASNFAINVDYTDFENFVHFSSAARRIEGFQYKLTNIELYASASASAAASSSPTAILDAQANQNKINNVIQNFDGWENYLYFNSSSYAWPKTNSTKPYINYSVTASQAVNWYNNMYDAATLYDDNNQNYMLYTLPGYIAENEDNELAFKFVASVGQMFDDVWIHIKAISDLYQAKNSLTQGISKDLVYFALQSMGIDTYTDQDGNNVFQYLYGVNEDGTYKYPTGSYQTLVSASNYQLSGQDQQKGIYKRLYSNLPLLLKSKGTTRFVQYLNTIFGIPTTIMSYLEYGGVDKVTSSFEYEYDRFTYALQSSGSNLVRSPWEYLIQNQIKQGYSDIVANGIELRFKAAPSSSTYSLLNNPTQSIFYQATSDFSLNLIYTQTGSNDSIYSGSTGEFGYFEFNLINSQITSSTIPVFTTGSNGDTSWYNVLVQRRYPNKQIGDVSDPQYYDIYVKNNVWGEIGHTTSASLYITDPNDNTGWYVDGGYLVLGGGTYPFSGSYQELRVWSNYLSESAFDSHVLNPESIEGNYTSSAYDDLAGRWPLGNDLYTYNHTLVSNVASVHPEQNALINSASFVNFPNRNNYSSFTETYYADVANSGYANPVTDKIRIVSGSTYGTQLLPNKSIVIPDLIPTTKDIHLLDASLSPQDEIDRDIIAQLGSTYNVDDIIGDPTGNSYYKLTALREEYFKKYIDKYDYKDYIRLIDFFHNSLFRTLKDFTPARTNLATGIVIKPHLLERPNVQIGDPDVTKHNNLSQSIDTLFITASNGGNYTQPTYSFSILGNEGPVTLTSDGRDFFTGVLPSASIFIHDDFDIANFNPYAIGYNPDETNYYSSSLWNVEFNPLLNNVELNQTSSLLKRLVFSTGSGGFTSGSVYVTESLQYQDFTNTYSRHVRGRYTGARTTSQLYNVFSTGDTTFGKTAAIDSNTLRFAFFSEAYAEDADLIAMPERTNLYIRYLIDVSGSLTELTKRNYASLRENQKVNLYEVQRIFKSGEVVNVGLFDNQNPSKQVNLDGNKVIFQGGFKYEPILWKLYRGQSQISSSIYNSKGRLTYTVNPTFLGVSNFGINISNVNYTNYQSNNNYSGTYSYAVITYDVTCNSSLTAAGNATITVQFNLDLYGLSNYIVNDSVTITQGHTGGPGYLFIPYEIISINSFRVSGITSPSATPGSFIVANLNRPDDNADLIAHNDDPQNTIISCSLIQSQYFGNFDFYSWGNPNTGASNGLIVTESINYGFDLNPGDIIRMAPNGFDPVPSFLYPQYEYTIMSVNKPTIFPNTPGPNFQFVTFTVDRPIDTSCLNTAYDPQPHISQYIFSRKIPNETNIVIEHTKLPGQSSGGIAKNQNLQLAIDDQVANITGELKSKIFSTVLSQ